MAKYVWIFGFSYCCFLLEGILKQEAESKKMWGQRSRTNLKFLRWNKTNNSSKTNDKPSKNNMSHPTSIPQKKQHLSVLHVFRFMFTTNVNHKCWLYLFKDLGSNHTNVISKPWHFRVLLFCWTCVCLLFRSESGCNKKLLDSNVPTCDTYSLSLFFRFVEVYPLKLTSQWKTTISNRMYIFKWWISHCYVSLQKCRKYKVDL